MQTQPRWQLQDAKNRFSELVEKAVSTGPQIVTRRGVETVVVVAMKDFKKHTLPKRDLVEFFAKSPLRGVKLELHRDKDLPRKVNL